MLFMGKQLCHLEIILAGCIVFVNN